MKTRFFLILIAFSLFSCGQKKRNDLSQSVQEVKEWFDYKDPLVSEYKNVITIRSTQEIDELLKKDPEEVKAIYIDSYDTTILIDDIAAFKNLEYLRIRSLDSVPSGFYNLKKLKVFISSNDLKYKLDSKIVNLQNLKYIKSGWTYIELPPEISKLSKLEVLKLNNFNKNQPFKEIYKLPKLRTLWMNFSDESQLEGISELKNLKTFVTNKVTPEVGNLDLYGLIIFSNNDTSYPKELSKLENLAAFGWHTNYTATTAPRFIPELKKLEYIEFRGCSKFSTIPKGYANLPHLKRFDICYNESYPSVEQHLSPIHDVIEFKRHW